MSSQPALLARGLAKRFKTGRTHIEVLKSVDFEALHGEVTMVMGPSGSGKSTLIASLSGLLKPDAGSVSAMGEDLWSYKANRIDRFRLDHCGFIFQGFNLFPALTALQQVEIILKYKGYSRAAAREKPLYFRMISTCWRAVSAGNRLKPWKMKPQWSSRKRSILPGR